MIVDLYSRRYNDEELKTWIRYLFDNRAMESRKWHWRIRGTFIALAATNVLTLLSYSLKRALSSAI
jgi:hypothetical protein